MGKGLPISAEVLAVSPSEHLNEPHLVWRPLSWNEETVRFPLAISAIPSLGEKHVISDGRGGWASTGISLAAGKRNEFVSTSRILYFYSHDLIGPYSFFNLGVTVQLIHLTLEFSFQYIPQQNSTVPAWPLWWAKKEIVSC